MIVLPNNWKRDYSVYASVETDITTTVNIFVETFIDLLFNVIKKIGINNLSYSGGIDSTVLLSVMTSIFKKVNTYTISSRKDHKDVLFANIGSKHFNSNHTVFIVKPNDSPSDAFTGDNAVRQFYTCVEGLSMIAGDGIDELMCGYYKHTDLTIETYTMFLGELLGKHLIQLNNNSGNSLVYLPYLEESILNYLSRIPLSLKVDVYNRKKIMCLVAEKLNVPKSIINRNKYGFVDAFISRNK